MRTEKAFLYGFFLALVGLSTIFLWARKDVGTYHIQKRLHMGK